ncbi:MAG: AraC family transcriptional regulator [Planctomycetota bacterium]
MLPEIENVPAQSGAAFAVRRFVEPDWPFRWHVHPEHELTLIVRGAGRRFVGDSMEDFGPGDLVLLASDVPHTWQADADEGERCESVVVQFLDGAIGSEFFDLQELADVRRLLTLAQRGVRFPASPEVTARLAGLPEEPPMRRLLGLVECLDRLAEDAQVLLASQPAAAKLRAIDRERIDQICAYVQQRYDEPIALDDVAAAADMSRTSFCRFFQRVMGRTFVEYLHEVRVSHACRLLSQTDLSIADIAFRVGFGNLANFNRVFKRLRGATPSIVRQRAGTVGRPAVSPVSIP